MFIDGLKLLWDGMDDSKTEEVCSLSICIHLTQTIQVKRVYIPIGNFFFLSDEKSRSKSFSTIEFNRVVEALDILKDVEVSTSVQSHRMDNYMKIARRNDLFFPGSYPAETTYMDGDYVLTVPRRLELIGRLKIHCCFCDKFLKV